MFVSDYSIEYLGKFIAGDEEGLPYRSGPKLVDFFNDLGFRDVYPSNGGFPTRRIFARDKLKAINGTNTLTEAIKRALDPRLFHAEQLSIQEAINRLNEVLTYDGVEVVRQGITITVRDSSSPIPQIESANYFEDIQVQSLIDDNIAKCNQKLDQGDYQGAITNARSLVEATLLGIIKEYGDEEVAPNDDLLRLFKQVQKLLNLEPDRQDINDALKQVLRGLSSIVNGLATMRNKMSDAHAASYRPGKHHAKLAVYAATTLVDFLFDTAGYQEKRGLLKRP